MKEKLKKIKEHLENRKQIITKELNDYKNFLEDAIKNKEPKARIDNYSTVSIYFEGQLIEINDALAILN